MQTPAFVDGQFVDGSLINGAVAQLMADFELIGTELHTPGLLNPSALTFAAPGGMAVNVGAPAPFAVLFGNGLVVTANGVVSGAVSTTYQVDFTSLVPTAGGAVTAYIVASYPGAIGEQQIQIVGPPVGHPDFDPTFAPFQFYLENLDTVAIGVSTTPADNVNTFELARTSLTVGQSTINTSQIVSGAFWHYASAVLNPTGVVPGTYAGATITVAADGRVSAASGVAYGPLAGNNTWTGNNTFNQPVTAFDPNSNTSGGFVVSGSAAGATVMLKGTGSGSTPNKWLRAVNGVLNVLNNAYAVILTLTDAGVLTVGSNITAGGTVHAGGALTAGAGALGSGDPTRATLLQDFLLSPGTAAGTLVLPNGFILQWLVASVPGGSVPTQFDLETPFPNNIFSAVISYEASLPPTAGNIGAAVNPAVKNQVTATNTNSGTNGCTIWILGN